MQEPTTIKTRQPGGGRKKAAVKKIKVPVSLEPDLLDWLKQFGERNRSKMINNALRRMKDAVEQKLQAEALSSGHER